MTAPHRLDATIGNTPLVHLPRLSNACGAQLFAKLELANPGGSVKDRIARAMLDDAEARGVLKPGATIVEPTSGNTGIALAMLAAARGYELILTLPETMSRERVSLLKAYGARVVFTKGTSMKPAVEQAEVLVQSMPDAVMLRQFDNPANPLAHETTTAVELLSQTHGELDLFIAGIGTGGTVTGVGRALKKQGHRAKVMGVEPRESCVLSGGEPGTHGIQGIGAGFVPSVLDRSVVDELLSVDTETAREGARMLAREEGVLAGISSGANLQAAMNVAKKSDWAGKTIVFVVCDTGERYLSTGLFGG